MARFLSDGRVWLIAAFLGIFYVLEIAPNWTTFRYKMTVEIQTPEGMKTGSSVVEYVRRPMINIPGIVEMMFCFCTRHGSLLRSIHGTKGLATIIDVGPQGWVVVPRIWAVYDLYKLRPGELHSGLPKITLRYSDGAAAIWIPPNGNISEGYYGVAGELQQLLGGVRINQIAIEPTSDTLLAQAPAGSPAWLDYLRARKKVLIVNPELKTNPHKNQYGLHVSQIEKGWW